MSYEHYFNCLWCCIFSFCRISVISEFSLLGIRLKIKTQKSWKIFIFWIYKAQMNVGLFFDHYFNFLSVKTDTHTHTHKTGSVWLNQRVKRFVNPNTCYMTNSVAEWFWVWCHLNSISTLFEAALSYYSIMAFLWNFRDFRVFVFWI